MTERRTNEQTSGDPKRSDQTSRKKRPRIPTTSRKIPLWIRWASPSFGTKIGNRGNKSTGRGRQGQRRDIFDNRKMTTGKMREGSKTGQRPRTPTQMITQLQRRTFEAYGGERCPSDRSSPRCRCVTTAVSASANVANFRPAIKPPVPCRFGRWRTPSPGPSRPRSERNPR